MSSASDPETPGFQASQFCASCNGLFTRPGLLQRLGNEYIHSQDIDAISTNAKAGCALCAWMEAMCSRDYGKLKSKPITFRMQDDRSEYALYGMAGSKPLEFNMVPYQTAKHLLRLTNLSRSYADTKDTNDSDCSRNLACEWVNHCWATHSACSRATSSKYWIPRRLLQIDESGARGTTVKVIDRESVIEKIAYLALSHRWGDASLLTLNSNTEVELKGGVSLDRLPMTFRDAVRVCKWFNIRHIWIDTLCIMQDSADDWLSESHAMKSVYTNATFTIAAGSGTSDRGLFVHRNQKAVLVPQVETTWSALPNGRYCLIYSRLWMRDVDYAPLSKRAWVVQERFLSSRVLFFGATQMFYECCESSVCESFPSGRAQCELGWEPKKLDHKNTTPMKAWQAAAKAYSEANLTRHSDKIIALAGVAEMCQERLGDAYIVGLWRQRFIAQLCWETYPHGHARPEPCIAPTWS